VRRCPRPLTPRPLPIPQAEDIDAPVPGFEDEAILRERDHKRVSLLLKLCLVRLAARPLL